MRGRTTTPNTTASRSSESLLLFLIMVCIGEFIVWGWCMFQQIATTHDSVLGLLQGGILIPTNMTAQQLLAFLQSSMDKDNRIAYTVAIVTQIVFLSAISPYSPIHRRMLRRIVVIVFFILEVTSDMWYSSATGTSLGGAFTFIFNLGGGGWLASLSYIVAMSAGSTLVGVDAFHKLQKILAVRQATQRQA